MCVWWEDGRAWRRAAWWLGAHTASDCTRPAAWRGQGPAADDLGPQRRGGPASRSRGRQLQLELTEASCRRPCQKHSLFLASLPGPRAPRAWSWGAGGCPVLTKPVSAPTDRSTCGVQGSILTPAPGHSSLRKGVTPQVTGTNRTTQRTWHCGAGPWRWGAPWAGPGDLAALALSMVLTCHSLTMLAGCCPSVSHPGAVGSPGRSGEPGT